MTSSTETLVTTTYDGYTIVTHESGSFPTHKAFVAAHRRKVRWYLRVNGLCRLPDNHDLTSKD